MDTTLLTVLATTSGTVIGALAVYAAAARQARASLASATLQFDAQLELASRQFSAETTRESQQARHQRLESAYDELSGWLDELDIAVENVWTLVCSDQEDWTPVSLVDTRSH